MVTRETTFQCTENTASMYVVYTWLFNVTLFIIHRLASMSVLIYSLRICIHKHTHALHALYCRLKCILYTHTHTHTHTRAHTHTHAHTRTCTHMYTCTLKCTHTYMYVHILYTYVYYIRIITCRSYHSCKHIKITYSLLLLAVPKKYIN